MTSRSLLQPRKAANSMHLRLPGSAISSSPQHSNAISAIKRRTQPSSNSTLLKFSVWEKQYLPISSIFHEMMTWQILLLDKRRGLNCFSSGTLWKSRISTLVDSKQRFPMSQRDESAQNSIWRRLWHPEKQSSPITRTDFGIRIDSRSDDSNARASMVSTQQGSSKWTRRSEATAEKHPAFKTRTVHGIDISDTLPISP